jgi:hypothetical protein
VGPLTREFYDLGTASLSTAKRLMALEHHDPESCCRKTIQRWRALAITVPEIKHSVTAKEKALDARAE